MFCVFKYNDATSLIIKCENHKICIKTRHLFSSSYSNCSSLNLNELVIQIRVVESNDFMLIKST